MNAQPLSRENSPSTSQPETAKASATKANATKASTAKASTTKTPRKTVAKTATRRRTATKSVPIVDFPTPDNVHSIPIQPDYPTRLATPSLTDHPASDRLRSQLAACHQVLTALQAESQELQQTMASLIAIASQMETLKPTHGTLAALTTPTPRKTSTRKTTSKAISQPEKATQRNTTSNTKATATQSKTTQPTEIQPLQPIGNDTVNYWGTSTQSSTQPSIQSTHKRNREIQLPNLTPAHTATAEAKNAAIAPETPSNPAPEVTPPATASDLALANSAPTKPSFHSSSLRTPVRSHSLTRQTVEYYAGYSHPPLELAKPSFHSQSQRAAQPVSQFITKPIAQPAIRSISRAASNPASIVPPSLPKRPQHLRLNTLSKTSQTGNRRRYTLTYLYALLQQTLQQLIPIPKGESAILFDAFCWTLSSIGLRLSCQQLINLLPILTLPLNFLLLFPALIASYLAFCIPKSSSATVYRCLLITLGFFIGGKL
jgi:hypothetical protein